VYDPYTQSQSLLALPGITNDTDYRIGGIAFSPFTSSIFIGAAASLPLSTFGANRTGNNKLIRYDTSTNSTTYIVDLETVKMLSTTKPDNKPTASKIGPRTHKGTFISLPHSALLKSMVRATQGNFIPL
jgi:hypothetical protein